jgi:GNAT superfamily N-acetyltransferase
MAGADKVRCVELEPRLWPTLEALFGDNGACGGCWCMWWRVERGGPEWQRMKGSSARRAFHRLVTRGQARGVLAFAGDEPVGWCALGPRADFPRTERVRGVAGATTDGVWAVNCFYVARAWRGKGVAGALLDAAMRACKRHGAREIEGYPYRGTHPGSQAWTGRLALFEARGFDQVRPDDPASKALVRVRIR